LRWLQGPLNSEGQHHLVPTRLIGPSVIDLIALVFWPTIFQGILPAGPDGAIKVFVCFQILFCLLFFATARSM
jgi:hypothetical protein